MYGTSWSKSSVIRVLTKSAAADGLYAANIYHGANLNWPVGKVYIEEMSEFEQYYRAPPQLLENFKYIKNIECKLYLAELSEVDADLMHY